MSTGSVTAAFQHQSLSASNNGQSTRSGSVTSSKYGGGTFESILNVQSNVRTIDTTTTYAGGTVISVHVVDAQNADGSETIDTIRTGPNGETTSLDKTLTHNVDGSETIHLVDTGANGKSTVTDNTITHNADGSETIDTVETLANGNKTTRHETITKNSDGSKSINGTITRADCSVITLTGGVTKTANGIDESLTRTNANGQTATYDKEMSWQGDSLTYDRSGTSFSGKSSSSEITWDGLPPFNA